MLTAIIRYKGKNGSAKKYAEEMISSGLVKKIRSEEGNLRYEYSLPLNNEDYVILIDSWTSQEALDIHHNLPIMKEILKLREKYDLHMEVEKYELIQDNKDEKYIRR